MSVLIKGMKMPKSCYSCPLYRVLTPSDSKCVVTDMCIDRIDEDNIAKICPLVEVPTPHGRLIDVDALKMSIPETTGDVFENCRSCEMLCDEEVKGFIDNAPTIIEAEDK